MVYSLWNNKKKINGIMKKLKFCESFYVYMDNIEYFSIWDIIYMYYVQSRADVSWMKIISNQFCK